jgi:multimeric flavodoxin WrbA
MNTLFLNGIREFDTSNQHFIGDLVDIIKRRNWNFDHIILKDKKITPCQGCFDCWIKTPGICRINDEGREITKKMIQSDLIIQITPITFGGFSSELKKAIDRSIPQLLPFFQYINNEIHHKFRYEHRASIISVGITENQNFEEEAIFKELVFRNSLNMGAPIHKSLIYRKNQKNSRFFDDLTQILNKVEIIV